MVRPSQETVIVAEVVKGLAVMQFRLLYSGNLLGASKTDTRAGLKHKVRLELHPQLKRLWETNRSLREYAGFRARDWVAKHPEVREEFRPGLQDNTPENWNDEELAIMGRRYIAEKWERSGRGYIPLATEDMLLRCKLDILFLRPEESGMLIKSGDLDNRMKTLFDALRLPANLLEAGGEKGKEGDEPIFCLMEDDRMISEVRIVTDHLLMLPHSAEFHANDVFLVIDVMLIASNHSPYHYWFS